MNIIKNQELRDQGFLIVDFPLDDCVSHFVVNKMWKELDDYFLKISKPQNMLHTFLSQYLDFNFLEHIISIRTAPTDEDGIWHDDGSRLLGFSLSLNLTPESIHGGELLFRKKGSENINYFSPQSFGKMILFLSGIYGHEHKVTAVTLHQRIVIAGWCSENNPF